MVPPEEKSRQGHLQAPQAGYGRAILSASSSSPALGEPGPRRAAGAREVGGAAGGAPCAASTPPPPRPPRPAQETEQPCPRVRLGAGYGVGRST